MHGRRDSRNHQLDWFVSLSVLAKLGGGFAERCESRIPNLVFLFIVFNAPLFCPLNAEFGDARAVFALDLIFHFILKTPSI